MRSYKPPKRCLVRLYDLEVWACTLRILPTAALRKVRGRIPAVLRSTIPAILYSRKQPLKFWKPLTLSPNSPLLALGASLEPLGHYTGSPTTRLHWPSTAHRLILLWHKTILNSLYFLRFLLFIILLKKFIFFVILYFCIHLGCLWQNRNTHASYYKLLTSSDSNKHGRRSLTFFPKYFT